MRTRKYIYLKVIQADYGCGWEDVDSYDKSIPGWGKEFLENYKLYRQSEPQYRHRAIDRRELNQ